MKRNLWRSSLMIALASVLLAGQAMASSPKRVSADEAYQAYRSEDVTFIDTRTEQEWREAEQRLPGALRVYSQDDLQRVMNQLPKNRVVIPYCT